MEKPFIAWNFSDKEIIISALVAHQCTRARWFSISGLIGGKEKVPVLSRGFKVPLVLVAMPKGRGPEKVKHSQRRRQRSAETSPLRGLSHQAGFHLRRQLAMKNRLMTPFTHLRRHTLAWGMYARMYVCECEWELFGVAVTGFSSRCHCLCPLCRQCCQTDRQTDRLPLLQATIATFSSTLPGREWALRLAPKACTLCRAASFVKLFQAIRFAL